MRQKTLSQLSGTVPSVTSKSINISLEVLLRVLRKDPFGQISWPSSSTLRRFSNLIKRRYPESPNVCLFLDGANFLIYEPKDFLDQNAFYNGWKASVFVANVFAYGFDGCIHFANTNCFGSWHDALVAARLLQKLLSLPSPYCAAADSASPHTGDFARVILTPLKADEFDRVVESSTTDELVKVIQRQHLATSIRVASEWGNHGLESVYARLHMPLPYARPKYRADLIETCCRLYNVRARLLGLNQIRKFYKEEWMRVSKADWAVSSCPIVLFYKYTKLFSAELDY